MNQIYEFSKPGRKSLSQDSTKAIKHNTDVLLAVADGIGGMEAGKEASSIAVETAEQWFLQGRASHIDTLYGEIAKELVTYSQSENIEQMGTTLTLCLVKGNNVIVGHVGDTRLYYLNGLEAKLLTKDQTEVQRLIDEGIITKVRAKRYHRRHVLTSALSNIADYQLQEFRLEVNPCDRLLLLSDGAYELLSEEELSRLSASYPNPKDFIEALENLIESKEIRDDYSAVLYQVA